MQKIANTETGSFFVKDTGVVYFVRYEHQTAKQLEEKTLEPGSPAVPAGFLEKAKENEGEARAKENDEIQRAAAERVGLGGMFRR